MSTVEERINELRQERLAREKARIEKLRELNLKKYNNTITAAPAKATMQKSTSKKSLSEIGSKKSNTCKSVTNIPSKRPSTVPIPLKKSTQVANVKPKIALTNTKSEIVNPAGSPIASTRSSLIPKLEPQATKLTNTNKNVLNVTSKRQDNRNIINLPKKQFIEPRERRKSMIHTILEKPKLESRKSFIPTYENSKKNHPNWESVFERLYKPKVQKVTFDKTLKPQEAKKVIKPAPIINKRRTLAEIKPTAIAAPMRRSISAVHFKKIGKQELKNCFHKWSSIGDNLNRAHLRDINEDENVKEDKIVSAVKSERKRVKFQTPVLHNFNTPRPEELQSRLQDWLRKRGKSLESFHHLQCFGLHHLSKGQIKPLTFEDACEFNDDENKENIALNSDSDDESYVENMNDRKNDFPEAEQDNANKWRHASYASSSIADLSDACVNHTISSPCGSDHIDDIVIGALNDLTELLNEGFDWEQCARWIRAIRERFPMASETAAYWECRAALEGKRGDLSASVHCWEEAIAKGTECSVVDQNLDQLLDKFMHLKISPNSRRNTQTVDPKLVDIKNVFKSTVIKFAVQEAKLRQSNHTESPKFIVTPVRRSGRLSRSVSKRTPLRICASVQQAKKFVDNAVFVPNPALVGTP